LYDINRERFVICLLTIHKRSTPSDSLQICLRKKRTCNSYKEEYTKGVIRTRISKNTRQHNGQKKKYKRTNNDRATQTPLKSGVFSGAPEGYVVPAPLVTPVVLI